jgi:o-succinylbenzoate---CoA ligase
VQAELEKSGGVTAAFVAGVESAKWGQAVAAYVAVSSSSSSDASSSSDTAASGSGHSDGAAWAERWHRTLGLMAPKTVLPADELIMLPNGKPDRLAMIERLNALHQGK